MVKSPAQSGRLKTLIHPGPVAGGHVSVLNVARSKIILDESGVCILVRLSKAVDMAQLVGMNGIGEAGLLAVYVQQEVDGRAM
jgi:hypothetical protein